MKKLLTALLLCIISLNLTAQEEQIEKIQATYISADKLYNEKQYKAAANAYIALIDTIEHCDTEVASDMKAFYDKVYYNAACCFAMNSNKSDALACLDSAVKYGYRDIYNITKDADLISLHNEKGYKEALKTIKENSYVAILQSSNPYKTQGWDSLPKLSYVDAVDEKLVALREHFNLDSIAGSGDDESRVIRTLKWVHDTFRHDGSFYYEGDRNAIDIAKFCTDTVGRGVNCRMLATLLNECYLALGYRSKFVTCMPKEYINDCHVINAVWIPSQQKWVWIDPTFNAYVKDENGNLLSIAEVRARLIAEQPLVLNDDANWNNQSKQTVDYYLRTYMAKNLYYVQARTFFGINTESTEGVSRNLSLIPNGFTDIHGSKLATTDDHYFWQRPE